MPPRAEVVAAAQNGKEPYVAISCSLKVKLSQEVWRQPSQHEIPRRRKVPPSLTPAEDFHQRGAAVPSVHTILLTDWGATTRHGHSHTKLIPPMIKNIARHPKWGAILPPVSMPGAEPNFDPA